MKVTIEVEPVFLQGGIICEGYYGLRIIGLGDSWSQMGPGYVGSDVVMTSSIATYPGNDFVREFINRRAAIFSAKQYAKGIP